MSCGCGTLYRQQGLQRLRRARVDLVASPRMYFSFFAAADKNRSLASSRFFYLEDERIRTLHNKTPLRLAAFLPL